MNLKNILVCTSLLVAGGLVLGSPQVGANLTNHIVASADTYKYSGSCGENATFEFDKSTGTLTISGTGDMKNFSKTPWENYSDSIKAVVIEYGVTSIGEFAFWDCESLKSVAIPDSVTSICGGAFRRCISLESIDIPDSVTDIDYAAFYECTSLKSVTIPDGVISIGDSEFFECESLESITIPSSIIVISSCAFMYCESLESINIPNGVTFISYNAFDGCTSLTDVYFDGTEEEWNNIDIDDYGNDPLFNATIHYNSTTQQEPVTADKLLLLQKHILGKSTEYDSSVDFNGDGKINVLDFLIAKHEILNQ